MANPLKIDPTRTTTLRRQLVAEFRKRFNRLKGRVNRLLIVEDAFGLIDRKTKVTVNTRWRFHTSQEKVLLFQGWLAGQLLQTVLDENGQTVPTEVDDAYWIKYIEEGFKKGAGRAFDDVKKPALSTAISGEVSDFYLGTKQQFLRSAFGQPEAVEKVKLLASRTFTDLKGVTEAVSADLSRVLTDGLVQGQNPRDIAANLNKRIQRIGVVRAETIARTEIIRAHAEGQLAALEILEVEEVGVMVEWSTAGDERVCPLCSSLQGIVVKVKEAHGLIPRHPNCRCSFIPANVGEDQRGQKRGATKLSQARDESIKRELGKNAKGLTQAQRRRASRWAGADTTFSKKRPESILEEKPTPKKKPAAKKPPRKPPSRPAKVVKKAKTVKTPPPAPASVPKPTLERKVGFVPEKYVDKSVEEVKNDLQSRFGLKVNRELDVSDEKYIDLAGRIASNSEYMKSNFVGIRIAFDKEKNSFLGGSSTKLFDKNVPFSGPEYAEVSGLYNSGTGLLSMSGKLNYSPVLKTKPVLDAGKWTVGGDFDTVFRHEYGHQYWFRYMSDNQRKEFLDLNIPWIRAGNNRGHKGTWVKIEGEENHHPISEYAATNGYEVWAESFAAYTHPNYVRGSLPRSAEILLDRYVALVAE